MAFLPPLVQTRERATCSLTVASGVGPPTITSTYFFCPRGSGRTDKQPWHTFTLKSLWLRSRKSLMACDEQAHVPDRFAVPGDRRDRPVIVRMQWVLSPRDG